MWITKFRHRKLQSVMIFFMVAICTMLMSGSLVILTSLQTPYNELLTETNPEDLRIYPSVNESITGKDWKGILSGLESVKSVEKVHAHFISETMEYEGKEVEGFIRFVEYPDPKLHKIRILEGSTKQLALDECIVPSVFAYDNNMKIGETFSVIREGEQFDYKIKAIFADTFSLNSAFSSEIFLKQIPDAFENQPYYSLWAKKGYNDQDIEREYEKQNEGIADASYSTPQGCITNASITENIMGAILLSLSVVVFLVVLFMIRYMVRNALLTDKKSIAVYKAMGYNNHQINEIYLLFYQSLAIAGGITGILFASVLSRGFLDAIFRNIGVNYQITGLWQRIFCFIIVNLLYLLTMHLELRKLKKLRPVEILSGTENNLGVKKIKMPKRTKSNFSPFAMAWNMMRRDRKNTIMIIITCFFSIYIVNVGLASFGNLDSMTEQNYYWLGFDKSDISVTFQGNDKSIDHLITSLKKDPDIQKVVKRNIQDYVVGIKNEGTIGALAYESFDDLEMASIEGRLPEHIDEIVLGTRKLDSINKSVGDYVDVIFAPGKTQRMLIVGSFQSFYNMGECGRILGDAFEKQGMDMNYTSCSVTLSENINREAFLKKMNQTYQGIAKFEKREDVFANILATISDPQREALGPFTILAVVVGALNLIYIIYLKNKNNQKTYSIYKSIGYPSSHLIEMNCWYVGIIAVISMIVAIPLFMFAYPRLLTLAMSTFGFKEYPVFYEPAIMILGNIGVLILFMFGTFISSRQIRHNHILDLMSE